MRQRIAIVVPGRFHAFDLARALIARGHDVTVLTNYPAAIAARFGLHPRNVRGFPAHGLLHRAAARMQGLGRIQYPESVLHTLFGRWAARHVRRGSWDLVHPWSGVAEEALEAAPAGTLRLLMRGSAHVRTTVRLLEEEAKRTATRQERPSEWVVRREEREYRASHAIAVLSSFALRSFVEEGVAPDRIRLLPLGADVSAFRPSAEVTAARQRRILSGAPLRVLNVGTVSFRKGLWDLAAVVNGTARGEFQFRAVGAKLPEAARVVEQLRGRVAFVEKRPQRELPLEYAWGDVFLFPTIEDGYAMVLAQAAAAGLPILTTPNCAGPDLVQEGETGWIVPVRSPAAILERLRWCDAHRSELAEMATKAQAEFSPRDWSDVAADFESIAGGWHGGANGHSPTLVARPAAHSGATGAPSGV